MNKSSFLRLASKASHALAAASLGGVLVLSLMSSPAHAQLNPGKVDLLNQLNKTAEGAYSTGQSKDLPAIVGQYISVFLGFLGMIALVLIIYAGWLWMFSRGNEGDVDKAKEIIKNAVIGLVIITLAYAISNFIIGSILNAANK